MYVSILRLKFEFGFIQNLTSKKISLIEIRIKISK